MGDIDREEGSVLDREEGSVYMVWALLHFIHFDRIHERDKTPRQTATFQFSSPLRNRGF